jgi:ABC-type bacteriocin/lantibiotic exporter with double-glycine peptidase domain
MASASAAGCYTCYTGTARSVSAGGIAADPSWVRVPDVPFVAQTTDRDCGAAALAMVLSRWRGRETAQLVAALAPPGRAGIRVGALRDVARRQGLQAFVVSGTVDVLGAELARGRPIVVGLSKPIGRGHAVAHYEVVVGLNRARGLILSLDPARGLRQNTLAGFASEWTPTRRVALIVSER